MAGRYNYGTMGYVTTFGLGSFKILLSRGSNFGSTLGMPMPIAHGSTLAIEDVTEQGGMTEEMPDANELVEPAASKTFTSDLATAAAGTSLAIKNTKTDKKSKKSEQKEVAPKKVAKRGVSAVGMSSQAGILLMTDAS